ncbi:MAG TPA: AMP-binding protein [Blastocatellia bacterium]|nr:AMP-binding protein [Blastocatellia bacterium]
MSERQTLLSFLDDCRAFGDETALAYWRGLRLVRWSYARLAATAYQFARELAAHNINKGDRVLFWSENNPEWIAAFYGCLLRGIIVVPLDRQSTPEFITRVQQQVKARLLLLGHDLAAEPQFQVPTLRLANLSEVVAHHSPLPFASDDIRTEDLIEIIFTSGTTAEPKGVCLSHRNFLSNLAPLEREINKYRRYERFVHPLRFLNLLPLSHVFGQFMGIFVPQLLASEVYFRESLNPADLITSIRKQHINVVTTFPRLLETLRDKIEREAQTRGRWARFQQTFAAANGQHFLKRMWMFRAVHRQFGWRFWAFISGGATLERETEEFWKRLGFAVIQGYGMTETASIISMPHPFGLVSGSIGKAMPGQEVKLNEKGEILVRGENIAAGYWSGEAGVKPIASEEGWLHTGDIGELDSAGNLFFRGRQKDVIVTNTGLNIYPDDLEVALEQQPEIRESCVIGNEQHEPLAVVIPSHNQADLATAIKRANESLAPYQQIRHWVVWPNSDFPRTTTTQKVIKRLVAETVNAKTGGNAAVPVAASSQLLQQIQTRSGTPHPGSSGAQLTEDLQLDSLGRVELLSALEDRYQIELDEAAFTAATTLSEIEKMVYEGTPETVPYPYAEWARKFPVTWLRWLVWLMLLYPLTRVMSRVRVLGREHLNSVTGPVLFVSNHITQLDPALILAALPFGWRQRQAIAMRGELLRSWRFPPAETSVWHRLIARAKYALVVALFNVFPLPQESGFRRSFAFAGETMDHGYNLLVFPEGRRTEDGRMNPFMSGIGLLVQKLNVPVIPVWIEGLFALRQQRKYFARPGQLTVTFGAPLRFTSKDSAAQITAALQTAVRDLEHK